MMEILDYVKKINSDSAVQYTIIRTIITYVYAIFLLRISKIRFKLDTPFDFVLIIILGAVLGRTIYGGASLLSTMIASFLLIFLHFLFATLSLKHIPYGKLLKGEAKYLIKNNKLLFEEMRTNRITLEDLREECRLQLHTNDLFAVEEAYLERNGKISFVRKNEPKNQE
jgi:uncharacterized membrane protein YcaP (DUF421 family)